MFQYFFPFHYRINIFTSLNVGPVLLKSAQHKHIPEVNCMCNDLLYDINSVKSLVQAYLALLEASDQLLIVAATSTLCVSRLGEHPWMGKVTSQRGLVSPPTIQ